MRWSLNLLNPLARLLLTATALAPVGLTYAWVAFIQEQQSAAISLSIISCSLVALCVWMLRSCETNLSSTEFKPSTVEAADHENTAFLLLYVLPLFTSKFNTLDWQFWIPTVLIFAVITATGYNYHFNPLLGLLGWHFYKVQSNEGVTYVLITRKHLRTAATSLNVGQLTEYILLDQRKP